MADNSDAGSARSQVLRVLGAAIAAGIFVGLVLRSTDNGWGWTIWVASAVGVSAIRAPFEQTNRANTIADDQRDGQEKFLLALVGLSAGVAPLIVLLTGWFSSADYDLPVWTYAAGAILALVGLRLFWQSHTDLGRNWSVTLEIREQHTLTTTGIYSRIRHPMYTSLVIVYASTPLVLHNWIAGLSGLIAFIVMCVARIPSEEAMMRVHFGNAYDDYSAQTGRLLPKLIRN